MKWLIPIFLCLAFTTNAQQTYTPQLEKKIVKRLHAIYSYTEVQNIREVVGAKSRFKGLKVINDTIDVVKLNVDRGTKYKGGFNDFRVAIWKALPFTQKDIKLKDKSVYQLRILIDTLGRVSDIAYVSGLKNDFFYKHLCDELYKLNNWKPAILNGNKVAYWLPLVFILKPSILSKTYYIKMYHPLKVKSVF